MYKTNGLTTPGGRPGTLENPHSFMEVGPMDSGEGQLSHINPFERRSTISRSPPEHTTQAGTRGIDNTTEVDKEKAELQNRLREMEKTMNQLNKQLHKLTEENEQLKKIMILQGKLPEHDTGTKTPVSYHTDEEELERETDWLVKQTKKRRRKRKAESSPEAEAGNFLNLSREGTAANKGNPNKDEVTQGRLGLDKCGKGKKTTPPPPIHVVGITKYADIKSLMASVADKEYKIVAMNNNIWKILTLNSDAYRALAKKLSDENKQWYTYEDKSRRPTKVMARGLHPTCENQEIKVDLQQRGFKIIDAVNIIKKERKKDEQGKEEISRVRLPLFMLTFDHEENVDNIYNIRSILNMRVKIEPLRKNSGLIPQCKKCQGFNHTQKFCHREPRCVKCLGKHYTSDCTINHNTPPTCVNCREQHPASYRGCEVAKQLQQMKNQRRQNNKQKTSGVGNMASGEKIPLYLPTVTSKGKQAPLAARGRDTGTNSYARAVKQQQLKTAGNAGKMDQVLSEVIERLDVLNKAMEKQKDSTDKILEKLAEQQQINNKLSKKIAQVGAQVTAAPLSQKHV